MTQRILSRAWLFESLAIFGPIAEYTEDYNKVDQGEMTTLPDGFTE